MKRILVFSSMFLLFVLASATTHAAVQPYNYNIETVGYLKLTNPPQSLGNMTIVGNRLYTAAHGFRAFDISDPANPKELYTIKTEGLFVEKMWVVGNYAIMSTFKKNFVIDLSQSNPTLQLFGVPMPVRALSGNLLLTSEDVMNKAVPPYFTGNYDEYTTSYTTQVWDITNPLTPSKVATIDQTGGPYTFFGRQFTATRMVLKYPPVWNRPLTGPTMTTTGVLYDVSDPANPRIVATGGTAPQYDYIDGTRGYTLNSAVYDLSDPLHAKLIGQTVYAVDAVYWGFTLNRTIGFVCRNDELMAIDYTRPGTPDFLLGQYRMTCVCNELASVGNYIYAYDAINKMLVILRYVGTWPANSQDAVIVKASSSVTVKAGQMSTISLTLRNSGAATWAGNLGFKLAVTSDSGDIVKASSDRICLPAGKTVAPGSSYTFSIPVLAPKAGNYSFSVQMVQEYVTNFGPKVQTAVTATAGSSASDWSGMN